MVVSNNYVSTGIPLAIETRASAAEDWSSTEVANSLDLETTNGEARWNASGSEIYLVARPAGSASNGYDIFVSVLQ